MAVASTDHAIAVREKISYRKLIRWAIVLLVIALAAGFGWRYWRQSQLFAGTDDAYINADRVEVAAQVSGPVTHLYVSENQSVKAGQPLFDIDPRPFELALAKAQAQLQLANQSVSQESAAVSAAEAQVAQRQAELRNAQDNFLRTRQLMSRGFLSAQGGEASRTQVVTARCPGCGAGQSRTGAQRAGQGGQRQCHRAGRRRGGRPGQARSAAHPCGRAA